MAVNFEIPTTEIKVGPSGFFTVRGIDAEDVTFLTLHYLEDMKVTVAKYGKKFGGALPKSAVAELAMLLAKDFPILVSEIISRCADAETAEDQMKFRRLPFPKQIEALKAIAALTVEDGGMDLKKVMGVVQNLLETNGMSFGPLMTSLLNTIETSVNQSST